MASGRIAGDGRFYRWVFEVGDDGPGYRLIRHDGHPTAYFRGLNSSDGLAFGDGLEPEPEQLFDSMTTVIKGVTGSTFASAAWWGYKVAAAAQVGLTDLEDAAVLGQYDRYKATKITPNSIRDAAGDRGNFAHDLCESYLTEKCRILTDEGGLYVQGQVGDDRIFAEPLLLESYNLAAARWLFMRHETGDWDTVGAERVVWSERLRVQGTFDLLRRNRHTGALEIVDYKTHKPAGRPAVFPAYPEDILQLRGYRTCMADMDEEPVPHQRVVLFLKDGEFVEDTRTVPAGVFDAVVEIYRALKALEKGES